MAILDQMIQAGLDYAKTVLGARYSRADRFRWHPGGSFDCSAMAAMIRDVMGCSLLDAKGNELMTSTYQVDAVGYDLLYPAKRSLITHKNVPSPKNIEKTVGVKPGDIMFFRCGSHRDNINGITHVGTVLDGMRLIQTATVARGAEIISISHYAGEVMAILRPQAGTKPITITAVLKKGSTGYRVRMLQSKLNSLLKCKLHCDGDYGAATETQVKAYQKAQGMAQTGVCDALTWNRMYSYAEPVPYLKKGASYYNTTGTVKADTRVSIINDPHKPDKEELIRIKLPGDKDARIALKEDIIYK